MQIYTYKKISRETPKRKSLLKRIFNRLWKKTPKPSQKRFWLFMFRAFAAGILLLALLFAYYLKDLPDPNKLTQRNVAESTKIMDRNGVLLYEIHGEAKRTLVELDQIPDYAKQATIAIEDKNFYSHNGISVKGIVRAVIVDIFTLSKSQGASTITQQFVKNAILSRTKSWDRKLKEIFLSLAIEARFSKDEILKLYLNEIPYGRNAYGIEAASQTYFNKSAKDLSLAQSAYLAAIAKAPTYYNPSGPNKEALDNRKNLVLSLMRQQDYITESREIEAHQENVEFSKIKTQILAPHFTLWVQDFLAQKFGEKTLQEGGLKIYTTLDYELQKIAEQAVLEGVEKNAKKYNGENAALVAIDPKTGQVLSMVGSKDYFGESVPAGCAEGKNCQFEGNVNVALAQRQPGSSFKPYVYLTAFKKENAMSPATMLMDVTTSFGWYGSKEYAPQNYDGKQRGPVSVRMALAGSLNIPAVKVAALVGVENATQTARDLGITSPMANCGLSLVLGGCEVRLLDHVAAMSVLANHGEKNPMTPILKILDRDGKILDEYQTKTAQVADEQAIYELTDIMSDNGARSFIFGPNSSLVLANRKVAAKTGTTQNWHDGWTLGFTPSLAAGVWVGNNDGTLLKRGADGSYVAAPIWNAFMARALKDKPAENFIRPSSIKEITVDALSGKLPTEYTPQTKTEIFADYAVPKDYDNVHRLMPFDSISGMPADSNTPAERIVYKPATLLNSEKPENPAWENPVKEWSLQNGYAYFPPSNVSQGDSPLLNKDFSITILEPQEGSVVSVLPLKFSAMVIGNENPAVVNFLFDGKIIKTLTTQPFSGETFGPYPDGLHNLSAVAFKASGSSAESNVNFEIALKPSLNLIEPSGDSLVQLPLRLTAESKKQLTEVSFFIQSSSDPKPILIGTADNTSSPTGSFQYTLNFNGPLKKGEYTIFAQSYNGLISDKIKISLP